MNSLANQLEELNSMKSHLEDTTEKYVTHYFCLYYLGPDGMLNLLVCFNSLGQLLDKHHSLSV